MLWRVSFPPLQESSLEAREVKPKFVDGAFVTASFGVPVRYTANLVVKGPAMCVGPVWVGLAESWPGVHGLSWVCSQRG